MKDTEKETFLLLKRSEILEDLENFIKERMDDAHGRISGFRPAYNNDNERSRIEAYFDVLEEIKKIKAMPVVSDKKDDVFIRASKNRITEEILQYMNRKGDCPEQKETNFIQVGKIAGMIEGLFNMYYMLGVNAGAKGLSQIDPYCFEDEITQIKDFEDKCLSYNDIDKDPFFFEFLAKMSGVAE